MSVLNGFGPVLQVHVPVATLPTLKSMGAGSTAECCEQPLQQHSPTEQQHAVFMACASSDSMIFADIANKTASIKV